MLRASEVGGATVTSQRQVVDSGQKMTNLRQAQDSTGPVRLEVARGGDVARTTREGAGDERVHSA